MRDRTFPVRSTILTLESLMHLAPVFLYNETNKWAYGVEILIYYYFDKGELCRDINVGNANISLCIQLYFFG